MEEKTIDYGALLMQEQDGLAQSAQAGFYLSQDTNPDTYAHLKRISQEIGVPIPAVSEQPEIAQKRAAIGKIDFRQLAVVNPATAMMLADLETAKLSHDNIENMTKLEDVFHTFAGLARGVVAGATFDVSAGMLGAGEVMARNLANPTDGAIPLHETDPAAGLIQATMAREARETGDGLIAEDVTEPLVRLADVLKDWRHTNQSLADVIAGSEQFYGNTVTRGIRSGFRSLGNMLPFMAASIATRNPMISLAGAGLNTFGQSAGQALDKGLSPAKSLAYGATNSAIEVATEAVPAIRFIGDLKAGSPLLAMLTNNLKAEVPGELIATTLQNFTEWAVLNPDEPFSSYLKELPGALAETVVATLAMGIGTAGIYGAANRFARKKTEDEKKAAAAVQTAPLMDQLNKLSAADKLLQRAPETFAEFVAQNAPEGAVFIDGQVLMQSGLGEQLAQISPSVAEQLPTAAELGSAVAIPIEEYSARIAPTELSQPLLEHLRVDPEGFSLAEAREYYQNAPKEYQEQIDKLTAEIEEGEAFRQSADAVFDQIKTDLDNLKRFTPEANTAYASLVSSFFATNAKKLGVTPEALWKEYAFTVRNEGEQGQYGQPVNANVNPDMEIPVVDLGGTEPLQINTQGAKDFVNRWKGAPLEILHDPNGRVKARLSSIDPDHAYWSSDIRGRNHETRRAALMDLERVLENAVRIEDIAPKHKGTQKTIRFFAAVSRGGKPVAIRIVAHEMKGQRAEIDGVELYDVIRERPGTQGNQSPAGESPVVVRQAAPASIKIRDLLSGVKDAGGKPYFQFAQPTAEQAEANRQYDAVVAKYQGTDQWMKAPNGKPTNLNERQWVQVRTENFKVWFGDWENAPESASKVVDENGEPLVVYHGTDADFDAFNMDMANASSMTGVPQAAFFSTSPTAAATYAGQWNVYGWDSPRNEAKAKKLLEQNRLKEYSAFQKAHYKVSEETFSGSVMPVFLNIRNPLTHDARGETWKTIPYKDFTVDTNTLAESARTKKHDGLVVENVKDQAVDTEESEPAITLCCFSPEQIKSAIGNTGTFSDNPNILYQNAEGPRGSFNPETFAITLNKNADFSTFLHEGGHFFLEVQMDMAEKIRQEMLANGPENVSSEKRQIVSDADALFKWFGIRDMQEWQSLTLEQKRPYHEQFARGFERYLAEGYSPNLEMRSIFQTFKDWLTKVYQDLTQLNVELSDEVREVFDRMLATQEEITTAEQARSLIPLFATAEEAGLSEDAFREYQAMGRLPTEEADIELLGRVLRDMAYSRNAVGRAAKRLQKKAQAARDAIERETRTEVMSRPVYRAWAFLTRKLAREDRLPGMPEDKSDSKRVDPTKDDMLTAIAKLGGISYKDADVLGIHPDDKNQMPAFGKYVMRREGGMRYDEMAQALAELGYLETDRHGKVEVGVFEDAFSAAWGGEPVYSNQYVWQLPMRPGEQIVNPSALGAGRFDMAGLHEIGASQDVIDILVSRGMTAKNGLHPDLVAENLVDGFDSGDALTRALAEAPDPESLIRDMVNKRMLEEYGDLATPAAIQRAADMAVHSAVRTRFVATEYNILARALGKPSIVAQAAQEAAARMISTTKIRDIRPGNYARAETRANKAAQKAIMQGDRERALAEKRNALLCGAAVRQAYEAQAAVEKGLKYLKKFNREVKGIDAEFRDQIDNILSRFDLRRNPPKEGVPTLEKFITKVEADGLAVDVPDTLTQDTRKHWRKMTMEEFRGLVATIRQLEYLGRETNRITVGKEKRELAAVREELVQSIEENSRGRQADQYTATDWWGKLRQRAKGFLALHYRMNTIVRVMDGGKDGGVMWNLLMRPINAAANRESTMRAEATEKLSGYMAVLLKGGRLDKKKYFESIGQSLTRNEVIAVALNWGNEGNRQRLLSGRGWTEAQARDVLSSLSSADFAAIQGILDHFETYRPLIAEKENRMYGKEPTWVEASPSVIVTSDGQVNFRGGYYPIAYDSRGSVEASKQDAETQAELAKNAARVAAQTWRGFTKERAAQVEGRPLLLDVHVAFGAVDAVIHDLCFGEPVHAINKLLRGRNNPVLDTIQQIYGKEMNDQIRSWLQDVAAGDRAINEQEVKLMSWLRQGISAAGLGLNVMSAIQQPIGLTQSVVQVGGKWIGQAFGSYISRPVEMTKEVVARSEFMRNRSRTRFRELNELQNQVSYPRSLIYKYYGQYTYWLMTKTQMAVDVITWAGAYEKAISENHDEDTAIALADQAVIDSQGGGELKDLSSVERSKSLKLFGVFYNFMGTALNMGITSAMTAKSRGKMAADFLLIYTLPVVLTTLLKEALVGGGDDWDMGELSKKLATDQLSYLLGMMMITRELQTVSNIMFEGKGMGYSGPTGTRIINDVLQFAQQARQGEFDDSFRKTFVNLIGDATGLPAAQANRTITGFQALAEGETINPLAPVFGYRKQK